MEQNEFYNSENVRIPRTRSYFLQTFSFFCYLIILLHVNAGSFLLWATALVTVVYICLLLYLNHYLKNIAGLYINKTGITYRTIPTDAGIRSTTGFKLKWDEIDIIEPRKYYPDLINIETKNIKYFQGVIGGFQTVKNELITQPSETLDILNKHFNDYKNAQKSISATNQNKPAHSP